MTAYLYCTKRKLTSALTNVKNIEINSLFSAGGTR